MSDNAPQSGKIPYALGQASVIRIPVPGTNGLCVELRRVARFLLAARPPPSSSKTRLASAIFDSTTATTRQHRPSTSTGIRKELTRPSG
jgi:hypothetical protein